MKANKCVYTLPSSVDTVIKLSSNNDGVHLSGDDSTMDHASGASVMEHVSCAADPRYDLRANTTARVNSDILCADNSQDMPSVCR